MFYLANYQANKWAHRDSSGEHDGLVTERMADAACFDTFAEASEYSQNFGPDWSVWGGQHNGPY